MNIGNLWNKQEELRLIDEISDKIPIEVIAQGHGRTVKAIEMRIESMIRKQYAENYSMSTLMKLYNKSEAEIKTIVENALPTPLSKKKSSLIEERLVQMDDKLQRLGEKINKVEKLLVKIYKKLK